MFRAHWEREAANWIAWVRRAGNDAYWDYAPAFFKDIVPGPRGTTLEIGCGEGRVARDLAARGHRVVGVDISPTLIMAARTGTPPVVTSWQTPLAFPSQTDRSISSSPTTR